MTDDEKQIIEDQIAPRLATGDLSLLLGAGFSIENKAGPDKLPGGDALKVKLLAACGKVPGPKTSLKDAYLYARRELKDFDDFFAKCFTVRDVFGWQRQIFEYVWSRIYTTNVDNVLDVAFEKASGMRRAAGDFKFFNYVDEGIVSATIGTIPVVTIHGTCKRFDQGFVFSTLEYATATNKYLDWHNDLAARMIAGGVVVVGNQLDESDFDSYVAQRIETYGADIATAPKNWLVVPRPDEIKVENLKSAGFQVLDMVAEEFFTHLFAQVKPRSVGEIVLDKVPAAKGILKNVQAMTWFKGAFALAFDGLEQGQKSAGILRHYITGADPDWYYIAHDAHATTRRGTELLAEIASLLNANSEGVGVLHVIGPSGSGKTTGIRNALRQIVRSYAVYEFNPEQSMDKEHFRHIVESLTAKAVFVFYSASDFYFAIKEIADRLQKRSGPYCLFVLEDRTSEYRKNKRQLLLPTVESRFVEFGNLDLDDARNIARKIDEAGLKFPKFSELPLDARARVILDKEKGFEGDLLSALFSLTTHENFEQKLFEDYQAAGTGLPRQVLDLVAIVHSKGYRVPLEYIAGALHKKVDEILPLVKEHLAGIVVMPAGTSVVQCRHRVIANYYFERHIAGQGDGDMLIGLLEFLSRQFTVEDIKFHPLAYRIYTELISFEFLYDKYFAVEDRRDACESTYAQAQKFYGKDGIFWLHFGRFYRKVGELEDAVDCFRTGLQFYGSYQTRHQLGLALLEMYLEEGEYIDFEEGVSILDEQRKSRVSDPYPTATLLQFMIKVLQLEPNNQAAADMAKECFNSGMKRFRDDDFFADMASDYIRMVGRK